MMLAVPAFAATAPVRAPAAHADTTRTTYIVRLADAPLSAYRGGIRGLAPTSPRARGEATLRVDSAASEAYLDHLGRRHQAARAAIQSTLGRPVDVLFDYRHAFNGFALRLSGAEAAAVRELPGVASVHRQYTRRIVTDAGPAWIGAPGVWDGSATGDAPGSRGEGIVVGVIDTGINHDHPSFADVGGDGYDHENPRDRFLGLCDPVTGAPFCNDKLIGVYDLTGTGPQDDHGHGSHTASTAAGNAHNATMHAPTTELERDVSGVAPHANVITYKACLPTGNCLSPSLVAAIDQATADGVDVINYSIGGGPADPWTSDDALAFLGAREAGAFAAVSAGNSGPQEGTIGSPANAPWVTSVGASTHDRAFRNSLVDLSGGAGEPPADMAGRSLTAGYGPAPIVYAADYGDALCQAPFPPGTFDGEIVLCDRGVNPRVEKGRNVQLGGAGGMVLANTAAEGESTVADPHVLPAVNLGYSDGERLREWLAEGEGHTATISGTTADRRDSNGDVMAGFSSRGPNEPVPDVVKPDVTAPGVDIIAAAHTVDPTAPPEYTVMSGTSMSSPHVAGAAALVRSVRPEWTPAEVQSALVSTAVTEVRDDDGEAAADPFDVGGGRVDLTRAAEAGLVLDVEPADFRSADPAAQEDGDAMRPSDLNLASLTQNDCRGECTWTRTVTNRSGTTASWQASTSDPDGVDLSVKPRRFRLGPGESVTVTVTAEVTNASTDWVFGRVDLASSDVPAQHLPVALRPGGVPQQVTVDATAAQGSQDVEVESPVAIRDFRADVFGLQEGRLDDLQLLQDPTPLDPYDGTPGTQVVTTEVPGGALSLATRITETTSTDLDLFVGIDRDGNGEPSADEEVCRSASATALESCTLTEPEAGTYWVMVQNWLTGQGMDDVTLTTAAIPGADGGNLTVTGPRGRVPAGETFPVTLAWDEPDMGPGTAWFALVRMASDRRHDGDVGSLAVAVVRGGS